MEPATAASQQRLIDELAPLRRPQTANERTFAHKLNAHEVPYYYVNGTIDRSLVRYATTIPWGERVYLVPVAPWSSKQRRRAGDSGHLPPVERIVAYSRHSNLWFYGNAARIRRGAAGASGAATIEHGLTKGEHSLELVPNGVTKVSWVLPGNPPARSTAGRRIPASRT